MYTQIIKNPLKITGCSTWYKLFSHLIWICLSLVFSSALSVKSYEVVDLGEVASREEAMRLAVKHIQHTEKNPTQEPSIDFQELTFQELTFQDGTTSSVAFHKVTLPQKSYFIKHNYFLQNEENKRVLASAVHKDEDSDNSVNSAATPIIPIADFMFTTPNGTVPAKNFTVYPFIEGSTFEEAVDKAMSEYNQELTLSAKKKVLALYENLAKSLALFHRGGLQNKGDLIAGASLDTITPVFFYGDLHSSNIMVTPLNKIVLVDVDECEVFSDNEPVGEKSVGSVLKKMILSMLPGIFLMVEPNIDLKMSPESLPPKEHLFSREMAVDIVAKFIETYACSLEPLAADRLKSEIFDYFITSISENLSSNRDDYNSEYICKRTGKTLISDENIRDSKKLLQVKLSIPATD